MKKKVLFVCLGNICRSPTAEGVFRKLVEDAGLNEQFHIDSCGTLGHHSGENADPRMQKHANKRGYNLTSIARGVQPSDFQEFDYILPMDASNYRDLMEMAKPEEQHKITPMTDFAQDLNYDHVPDPYYGGPDGFELVLDILEDACQGFLQHVQK